MIGCSNSENKKIQDNQILVPTSISSFFETAPSLISLDSTYFRTIEKWNEIISFSEKFSDLIEKKINHKSKISALSIDLNKIKKETIPSPFNTPPIIGRLRVLKTFTLKIDSYLLTQESIEEYTTDLNILLDSYNALIYQINLRAKEILN